MVLILVVLAAVFVAVIQSSFFEWAFHRFWLHRPWLPKGCFTTHTLIHHQLCKFEDTFQVVEEEQHEALHFAWWGGPLLVILNLAPWLLAAWACAVAGLAFSWVPFLVTAAVTFSAYYVGYEGSHYLMHKPRFPWIERSRFFRFLERHHRIHHVLMGRNLNVLLPIADFALGTLVTEMPTASRTPASARKVARRHSRYGKRIQGDP